VVQGEDEPVFCLGPDYSSSEEIYSVSVVDLNVSVENLGIQRAWRCVCAMYVFKVENLVQEEDFVAFSLYCRMVMSANSIDMYY
jgi:hypothetical protein